MTVNPLQLRKNYEAVKNLPPTKEAWLKLFMQLKFTNQILENHKIKNFNISSAYKAFEYSENVEETFYNIAQKEIRYLKKYTDEMLLKDKIKCKQSSY